MLLIEKITEFYKKYPALVIALAIVVILPLLTFAIMTPAKAGTRMLCKYGHSIKDDTHWTLVFRWNADDVLIKVKTTICLKHKKLEALWDKARKAQKKGDLNKALELYKQIQAADPSFKQIDIVVADVESAISGGGGVAGGSSGGSSGGDTTGPGDQPGQTPEFSGDITSLFPSSIEGYKQVRSAPGKLTASRLYAPVGGAHPTVSLLTIQFDQTYNEKAAEQFIINDVKTYYAADPRNTNLNGLKAYFGTDGQACMLAYHANGVVFEIEIRPKSDPPKDMYDEAVAVASSMFPIK